AAGPVSVTTPGGTEARASNFAVTVAPTISSFGPSSAPVGSGVTITGSNFTGATTVTFNGMAASLTVSDTQINTTVPGGADSGKIRVTKPAGSVDGASAFTVTGSSTSTSVEVRVSASSDDAEEQSSGTVSLTSSDLELVYDGNNQTVGMRFTGVNIPRGATIVNAYVQFQVDETNSEPTALTI